MGPAPQDAVPVPILLAEPASRLSIPL